MYPYLPEGREILYIEPENVFMKEATKLLKNSGCVKQSTAAVIVDENEKIIGRGTNAGKKVDVCPRVTGHCPTGTGYELCKSVCRQEGHAEIMALRDANYKGKKLFLDGHWWICKPCWDEIIKSSIEYVYLRTDSVKLYKKLKIFLISPVREAESETQKRVAKYVKSLETFGHQVHWPIRDTKQDDPTGGYTICKTNFQGILDADEIHIWYDETSQGSKFDMGGVFMIVAMHGIEKRIVIPNKAEVVDNSKKSFFKVFMRLSEKTK